MQSQFDLASNADDAALRRLLATSPVPGSITLSYEREPCYFDGCTTMGPFVQVIVGRAENDELLGLGCRAIRPLFINGQPEQVGYLGQLRIAEPYQGRWLLAKAFRFLRDLHADGRTAGYITTIVEQNDLARGVLVERPLRHFPRYRELDRVWTLAIILSGWDRLVPQRSTSNYTIERTTPQTLSEVVAFWNTCGAARQFFPCYSEADFGGPLTRGFATEDLLLARKGNQIVGTLGLWDQRAYKQTVVRAYGPTINRLRPLYGLLAKSLGAHSLPPIGAELPYAYAAFICIRDDDPRVFALLLRCARRLAAIRGYTFLMLGLTERDPLLPVARRQIHIPYHSRLYTVCWDEDQPSLHKRLDGRVLYAEIASL